MARSRCPAGAPDCETVVLTEAAGGTRGGADVEGERAGEGAEEVDCVEGGDGGEGGWHFGWGEGERDWGR